MYDKCEEDKMGINVGDCFKLTIDKDVIEGICLDIDNSKDYSHTVYYSLLTKNKEVAPFCVLDAPKSSIEKGEELVNMHFLKINELEEMLDCLKGDINFVRTAKYFEGMDILIGDKKERSDVYFVFFENNGKLFEVGIPKNIKKAGNYLYIKQITDEYLAWLGEFLEYTDYHQEISKVTLKHLVEEYILG